jgi:hypothetical protein
MVGKTDPSLELMDEIHAIVFSTTWARCPLFPSLGMWTVEDPQGCR